MAYTPASRAADGLITAQLPGRRGESLVQVRVRCSASVLPSCLRCSSNARSASRLIARRPKYRAASVPVSVRKLTPAAITAPQ